MPVASRVHATTNWEPLRCFVTPGDGVGIAGKKKCRRVLWNRGGITAMPVEVGTIVKQPMSGSASQSQTAALAAYLNQRYSSAAAAAEEPRNPRNQNRGRCLLQRIVRRYRLTQGAHLISAKRTYARYVFSHIRFASQLV